MSRWTFGLTELPTTALVGAPIGALRDCRDRFLSLRQNAMETASFTIRLDNPLAKEISDRNGDVMLKVYRDSTLEFYGDLTSIEEIAEGDGTQTMSCNFAGPLWRLSKRLGNKDITALSYTDDRSQIMKTLVEATNAQWDTGIRIGSLPTTPTVTFGPIQFKPISEAFAELASLLFPAYVTRANFASSVAPEASNTDDMGNTWSNFGDANVFITAILNGTVVANRGDFSDTLLVPGQPASAPGRAAIAGHANSADVVVGMDYYSSTGAAVATSHGLIARYVDANNFVVAWATDDAATAAVAKVVGGTWTNMTVTSPGIPPVNSWNSMQLSIDTSGNYKFYHYVRGSDPTLVVSGTDSALASPSGTLKTGKTGFFDGTNAAGPAFASRSYTNFFAYDPGGVPLGIDFRFVPTEPTADTGQAGVVGAGVQIATLNTGLPLGSNKPHAVFEYGSGSQSVTGYRLIRSREGLLTQGYSLPDGFPDNSDVRSYPDDPTFAATVARGLYEEVVPSDVVNGDLRRGVVIRNVEVRKQARQNVTFDPSPNGPVYGADYGVGDTVTARAVINGEVRYDSGSSPLRVWGVDIKIDENGKATETPILAPE